MFLASVERKAFRIAQIALRHEADALDVVQDAMLQLSSRYGSRPPEEWRPLFYRILENRVRDVQRRRSVRNRVMAYMPWNKDDDEDAADPIDQAVDRGALPPAQLESDEAMAALEQALAGLPARQRQAFLLLRRPGRCRNRSGHEMFPGQRQDPLFSGPEGAAQQARRVPYMTIERAGAGDADGSDLERRSRALLQQSADALPGAVRSRLTQARYAALAARPVGAHSFARRWVPAGAAVAAALALLVVYVPRGHEVVETPLANAGLEDIELLSDNDAMPLDVDQDVDDDFYEWAADVAAGSSVPAVGS
jgi:RNA polymerase sigma-70 factor (ECF subfamily)